MCHLSSRRFLIFFLSALIVVLAFGERGNSQSRLNRRSGTPAAPVQLKATKDDLTLTVPLAQSIERPIHANVRLVLVSPEDIVRAQLSQDVQLVRHQKQLMLRLAKPFERVPAQEMEILHWLRVKYEVTSNGEILASGIEALRAATTDPFVLTAAAMGPVKTETSRKLMPIDEYVARDLLAWYEVTPYKKPSDYVWATDANRAGTKRGKQPVWLSTVMRDYIQPVARQLGINKKMSWHTFRHTFSSILKSNGEDVKVVQELLRHSTSRMTLDTYTQALRSAQAGSSEQGCGYDTAEGECIFCVSR